MQTNLEAKPVHNGRVTTYCRRAVAVGAGLSAFAITGPVFASPPAPDETVGAAVTGAQTGGQAFVVEYVIPAMLLTLAFIGILGIGWVSVNKIYRKFKGA